MFDTRKKKNIAYFFVKTNKYFKINIAIINRKNFSEK